MPFWKWQPDNCRLEEVDAAKFCDVMEGRKGLLFVGEGLEGRGRAHLLLADECDDRGAPRFF